MRIKGLILDEVRVLDQANENGLFDEDGTLLSEDRAILIRAESVFAGSGFSALAAVGIRFEEHRIVLYGTLPSYFLMQMAQELIRSFLDHRSLVNKCSVVDQCER